MIIKEETSTLFPISTGLRMMNELPERTHVDIICTSPTPTTGILKAFYRVHNISNCK
ncbi:hypothetical protein I4U23_011736 [Adineta vaga]|nr:hypothetical protein I4U23_011736 [Adineta vaga]